MFAFIHLERKLPTQNDIFISIFMYLPNYLSKKCIVERYEVMRVWIWKREHI